MLDNRMGAAKTPEEREKERKATEVDARLKRFVPAAQSVVGQPPKADNRMPASEAAKLVAHAFEP